jgi:hypothetical protein
MYALHLPFYVYILGVGLRSEYLSLGFLMLFIKFSRKNCYTFHLTKGKWKKKDLFPLTRKYSTCVQLNSMPNIDTTYYVHSNNCSVRWSLYISKWVSEPWLFNVVHQIFTQELLHFLDFFRNLSLMCNSTAVNMLKHNNCYDVITNTCF